jgi:hypothetical protein
MEPIDEHRIETDALDSIWRIERLIWGVPLKRKIRNERSRFHRNVPKFGVPGSALLLVGNLWMRVVLFFAAICTLTAISFGQGTATPQVFALVGIAFFILATFRMKSGSNMSKRSF